MRGEKCTKVGEDTAVVLTCHMSKWVMLKERRESARARAREVY